MTDAVTLLARKISQSGVVAAVSNLGDRGGVVRAPPRLRERSDCKNVYRVENNETHIILIMFWTQVIVVLFNLIYCMCDLFPCQYLNGKT